MLKYEPLRRQFVTLFKESDLQVCGGGIVPSFERVSLDEAMIKTATGKRAERLREYTQYVQDIAPGGAGKLTPGEGETAIALRRRLNQAAKLAGRTLAIRRLGDEVYFWIEEGPRRRGRPRKNT